MGKVINPAWAGKIRGLLDSGQPVDETTSFTPAAAFLIQELTLAGRAFRVYTLGAGVRRITTDTDSCPMCKRELEGRE